MNEKKVTIDDNLKSYCFGCSKENPQGLQLDFTASEGMVKAVFTPGKYHQSWPGMTHGGILFSLLDEAGGHAVRAVGVRCVTAKCETQFINPAVTGVPLTITAKVISKNSRTIETEAIVQRDDGTLVAATTAIWYIVDKSARPFK